MRLFCIIGLLAYAYQVKCSERWLLPEIPSKDESDPILSFMQRIYNTREGNSSSDAGAPLILTPYIEQKKFEEARRAASVDPAFTLPNMTSYAGYLTVNKEYNANLWFWYFPVSGKSVEDTPWIIWLQGGPGVSSLYGLFKELGPIKVNKDLDVEEMKYSWGKNHSLLFIDNPVGTGFSFTDDDGGYATNLTTIGENMYTALQQFLTLFPELRRAPLTIAGESYAGKYVPSLGIQILWHRVTDEPINLQGLAIGNGLIDPLSLLRYSYFVREIGLVDDKIADGMKDVEATVAQYIKDGEMVKAYDAYWKIFGLFHRNSLWPNLYNYIKEDSDMDTSYVDYIQTKLGRKALHVGNTKYSSFSRVVYNKLIPDIMNSSKMWLEELLENYKVMVYNGQLDIIVAYHPSVNTYKSLSFSGSSAYKTAERRPWLHDGELAGYYKVGGNLTEVMVRNAGHVVPTDQPSASLGLISAFARGITLVNDTGKFV